MGNLRALEVTLHQLRRYYTARDHHHHDRGGVKNAGLVLLQLTLHLVDGLRNGNIVCVSKGVEKW